MSTEYVEVTTQAELDKVLADVVINQYGTPNKIPVCKGNGYFKASGSVSVRASGSVSVRAYGSVSVRAYGSVSVRAYGSVSVEASKFVAVHDHGGTTWNPNGPTINGGVVIKVPKPRTPEEWCDYRGVDVNAGVVILYKAVNDEWLSGYNFSYAPGSTPVAPDWDGGENECGGGLHFCARPAQALTFNRGATKFVGCPVRLEDIAVHEFAQMPSKVKARGCCGPVFEVDIDGERVEPVEAAA